MHYIVTGCAGFIGSHLCERLLNAGHSVVGVDCFTDYYAREIKQDNLKISREHPEFKFLEKDLNELDLPALVDGADGIYHLAAQAGVRASWGTSFDIYLNNNLKVTQRLLEAIKDKGGPRMACASSSSVYGDTDRFPTPEDARKAPLSPYGVTKIAGEAMCYLYEKNHDVDVVSLRYFTVYGPRQRPDMAFHRFIKAMLTGGPITVFGDGSQTRDFTYVDDIIDGTIGSMEKGVGGRAYNLGGGHQTALIDTIRMIETLTGGKAQINFQEKQKGDVKDTASDTSLARADFDYAPNYNLEKGLAAEVEWVKELLKQG